MDPLKSLSIHVIKDDRTDGCMVEYDLSAVQPLLRQMHLLEALG